MGFRIFYRFPQAVADAPNAGPRGESYVGAALVFLPWHPSYRVATGVGPGSRAPQAMVQPVNSEFKLGGAGPAEPLYTPILYQGSPTSPTSFLIRFQATVAKSSDYFAAPEDFRLQPIRSDAEVEALIDFSIQDA